MIPLFIGLTLVNLVCLVVTASIGFGGMTDHTVKSWHLLAGVMATLTCIAVHCIVFTYFIATSKWVQHAIAVKRLDPDLAKPTRSFRAQAFPAALLAMASVFATAVLGAATDNYSMPLHFHRIMAFTALTINAGVAFVEFGAIARNGRLIDDILEKAKSADTPTTAL